MAGTLGQIILFDAAFSLFAAVLIAVGAMMLAAGPLSRFLGDNPTVATLALGCLLMIGTALPTAWPCTSQGLHLRGDGLRCP